MCGELQNQKYKARCDLGETRGSVRLLGLIFFVSSSSFAPEFFIWLLQGYVKNKPKQTPQNPLNGHWMNMSYCRCVLLSAKLSCGVRIWSLMIPKVF